MQKERLYLLQSVLLRFLRLVLAFSIVFCSIGVSVDARSLPTVKIGGGQVSSGWVYGTKMKFNLSDNGYIFNSDLTETDPIWDSDTYIWSSTINVPMSMANYTFGEDVSSVIMSLTSSIDYGFTAIADVHEYIDLVAKCNVREAALIINGVKYYLPILNSENIPYVSSSTGADLDIDSNICSMGLSSYVSYELNNLKSLSQWDISLQVTFDLEMTYKTSCELNNVYIQPWLNWYIGTGNETFTFYCYDDGLEMQRDLVKLQQEQNNIENSQLGELQEQTEQQKEQTETQKGIFASIKEFFGGFFDNLKNSVIGLFVPSKEEMSGLIDRLMNFFNETFGFLFYPFDFIIRLVDLFLISENTNTVFTFPGFSIMGMQVWETMQFDLAEYEVVRDIFGYVRLFTGAIISFGFINYLRRYFDKRFGGGGN